MQVKRARRKKKSTTKKYRFIKGQNTVTPRKRKKKTVLGPAPSRNSIKKSKPKNTDTKKRTTRVKSRKAGRQETRPASSVFSDTPGWDDLRTANNDRVESKTTESKLLSALSTVRISLGILAVAALFTLYVGHVQATKDLLNDVYQARKDNFTLNLKYSQLQGEYDTAIGPGEIYERAGALGLEERKLTGPPIRVDRRTR